MGKTNTTSIIKQMQVGAEILPAMGPRKKPSGMQVLLHETFDKFGSHKGSSHSVDK